MALLAMVLATVLAVQTTAAITGALPTGGPPTFWSTFWFMLPSILAQLAVLIGALTGFYRVWRARTAAIMANTHQTAEVTKVINTKVDSAAALAAIAADKADQVHITAQEIIRQAEIIAQQTNGQLSKLLEDKDSLRTTLQQVLQIIAAREAKVPGVREEDLPKTEAVAKVVQAVQAEMEGEDRGHPLPTGTERRQSNKDRRPGT